MSEQAKRKMREDYNDLPDIIRRNLSFEMFSIAYKSGYIAKGTEIIDGLITKMEKRHEDDD